MTHDTTKPMSDTDTFAGLREARQRWIEDEYGNSPVPQLFLDSFDAGYRAASGITQAPATWRCFHCDEVFMDRRAAWEHFGEENCVTDVPACIDPLRADEKARLKELREAQEHATKCQRETEETEDDAAEYHRMQQEIPRLFGEDVTTLWLASDRYKSALNEIEALKSAAHSQREPKDESNANAANEG